MRIAEILSGVTMVSIDALRWNERYQAGVEPVFGQPRLFLIEAATYLPARGLALDVAMGQGGNAGFLIERGLSVIGIDASEVALQHAKARWPMLMAIVADLTRFQLPEGAFDAVLNFYYLQRDLWPAYRKALRPGGLLIFESLTRDTLIDRPDFNPDYLLAPGELRNAFADWEILEYREGSPEVERDSRRVVASLVARRP
jgi:tellurite methyltransferase